MSEDRRHNREAEGNRPLAELLSAYLDDRESLSSDELAQVERSLADDPAARQIHAEMDVIRLGLRELEPLQAPRAFHLDAEMIGAPEPVAIHETHAWYVRHVDSVRWATAAAAVLFVFVLGADLVLNGVFSGPADSNDSPSSEQADVMVRQADDDAAAGAGEAATEAVAEEAAGDSGGEEAPPIVTPEVAEDAAGDDDAADDETEDEAEDPSALAPAPEEEGEATDGADEAVPAEETETTDLATDEAPADMEMAAFQTDEDDADEGTSDRQIWRIAEFSLVVLLGLLITAVVVLPRLGRNTNRPASD